MGIETAIMAAVALGGAAMSGKGMLDQAQAKKDAAAAGRAQDAAYQGSYQASVEASDASLRGAKAREAQMLLDNKRQQRQLIREAQVARSQAIARAGNSGAGVGPLGVDSSVLSGQAQVTNQQGFGTQVIGQNVDIGKQLFQSDYDILAANKKAARYGTAANLAGTQLNMAQANSQYASAMVGTGMSIMQNAGGFASNAVSIGGYAKSLFQA